jgi:hypothetical protein
MWLNIAVILYSAAIILYAPFRHSTPYAVVTLVLIPTFCIVQVRRMKADGTGDVSLSELHSQVKAGRRLPRSSPLENAAAAAILLASYFLYRG